MHTITCSKCDAPFTLPKPPAGARDTVCPKCRPFTTVPDTGAAAPAPGLPARSAAAPRAKPFTPTPRAAPLNIGLVVGVGAAALLLVVGVGVLVAMWMASSFNTPDPGKDQKQPDPVALKSGGDRKQTQTGGKTAGKGKNEKKGDKQDAGQEQPTPEQDRKKAEEDRLAAEKAREEKLKAEYEQQMKLGETALEAKRYDDAVTAFTKASELMPESEVALIRLAAAQQAQANAQFVQPKGKEPPVVVKQPPDVAKPPKFAPDPKRGEQFTKFVAAARLALEARNVGDAVEAIAAARRIDPANPILEELDRQVNQLVAAFQNAKGTDAERRQVQYALLLKRAVVARSANYWNEAARCYQLALQMNGEDIALRKALDEVLLARDQAQLKYQDFVARGALAMQAEKPWIAIDWYGGAVQVFPESDAPLLLRQAQLYWDSLKRFAAFMKAGDDYMRARQYRDALAVYNQALLEFPEKRVAIDAQFRAQQYLDGKLVAVDPVPRDPPPFVPTVDDPKQRPIKKNPNPADIKQKSDANQRYNDFMARGQAEFNRGNFVTAANLFRAALNARPGDPDADAGLRNALNRLKGKKG
jgi:tetratricopeptide (TPR) repeat protein